MASQTLTTRAVIRGVDALSGPLSRMAAKVQRLQGSFTKMQRQNRRFSRSVADVGGTGALGAGILGGAFLRDQFELEKSLNRSRAILDLTKKEFKDLESEIVRLAALYPLTMRDAARASVEFGQAGLEASTQIAIFEQAVKGAMASGVSVEKVAQGVTDVVMGLGLPFKTAAQQAESFRRVNDLLAASAVSANQTYEDFLAGFRKAAPVAAALGVPMQTLAVYLGALANAGIKAERAGTAMRTIFIRPLAPTQKLIGLLAKYGLTLDQFTSKSKSWEATGDQLNKMLGAQGAPLAKSTISAVEQAIKDPALKGNSSALAQRLQKIIFSDLDIKPGSEDAQKLARTIQAFTAGALKSVDLKALFNALGEKGAGVDVYKELFGLRHIEKALALQSQLRSGSLDTLQKKIATKLEYRDGKGPTDRFMNTMLEGFPGAVQRLNSAIDLMSRKLATSGALSVVADLADSARDLVVSLSTTSPAILKWATLAGLAAAAMAPLGFAFMGIAAAAAPLLAAAGGVASVAGSVLGLTSAAIAGAPIIAKYAKRLPVLIAAIMAGKKAIPVAGALAMALRFGGVGLAIGAVTAGVVALGRNLREIGALAQGFGSGFLDVWSDAEKIDPITREVVGKTEGLATKIGNLMRAIFGGETNAEGIQNALLAGAAAGRAFGQALGMAADGATALVNGIKQLIALIPSMPTLPKWATSGVTVSTTGAVADSSIAKSMGGISQKAAEPAKRKADWIASLMGGAPPAIAQNDNAPSPKIADNVARLVPKSNARGTQANEDGNAAPVRSQPFKAQEMGTQAVTVQGGNVTATVSEPLKIDGKIETDVKVNVQGNGTAQATTSGVVKGPANALPVAKSNNSRTGS